MNAYAPTEPVFEVPPMVPVTFGPEQASDAPRVCGVVPADDASVVQVPWYPAW
jgi:hypothetical protein